MKNREQTGDTHLEYLRGKRDSAWEMAGLARQEQDLKKEAHHTSEARRYQQLISQYLTGRGSI